MPTIVNGKSTIPADAVHSIKKNTVALKGQSDRSLLLRQPCQMNQIIEDPRLTSTSTALLQSGPLATPGKLTAPSYAERLTPAPSCLC